MAQFFLLIILYEVGIDRITLLLREIILWKQQGRIVFISFLSLRIFEWKHIKLRSYE